MLEAGARIGAEGKGKDELVVGLYEQIGHKDVVALVRSRALPARPLAWQIMPPKFETMRHLAVRRHCLTSYLVSSV
jgi:hypothetical protein